MVEIKKEKEWLGLVLTYGYRKLGRGWAKIKMEGA